MTNSKSLIANEEDDGAWDVLFPHCTEHVGDYLNPEGADGDISDIKSSAHIEITTQGDETEGVGTLETSEAPTENVPLPVAPTGMHASKVSPATEAAVTEHVTII